MAEALKIKIDENTYKETIDKLSKSLTELQSQREKLNLIIDKMNGDAFGGSRTKKAKEAAKETLNAVQRAIDDVIAQKNAIQNSLSSLESYGGQLETDASEVMATAADLFK